MQEKLERGGRRRGVWNKGRVKEGIRREGRKREESVRS